MSLRVRYLSYLLVSSLVACQASQATTQAAAEDEEQPISPLPAAPGKTMPDGSSSRPPESMIIKFRVDLGSGPDVLATPQTLYLRAFSSVGDAPLNIRPLGNDITASAQYILALQVQSKAQEFELWFARADANADGTMGVRLMASFTPDASLGAPVGALEALAPQVLIRSASDVPTVVLSPASSVVSRLARALPLTSAPSQEVHALWLSAANAALAHTSRVGLPSGAQDFNSLVMADAQAIAVQLVSDVALQQLLYQGLQGCGAPSRVKGLAMAWPQLLTQWLDALGQKVLLAAQDGNSAYAQAYAPSPQQVLDFAAAIDAGVKLFAPTALTFADEDPKLTVAGTVALAAAPLHDGIAAYRLYAGGPSRANAKQIYLGALDAGQASLAVGITDVVLPDGCDTLWAFAALADGTELASAHKTSLHNDINYPPPGPFTGFLANPYRAQMTLSWSDAADATGYTLERGTQANVYPTLVARNALAPTIDPMPPANKVLYYRVTATNPNHAVGTSQSLRVVSGPWVTAFTGPSASAAVYGTARGPRGEIYAAGHAQGSVANSNAGPEDVFISRLTADGNLVWQHQFGAPGAHARAARVAVAPTGELFVAGSTDGDLGFGPPSASGHDAFVARLDPDDGHVVWLVQRGGDGNAQTHGMGVAVNGNAVALMAHATSDLIGNAAWPTPHTYLATYDFMGSPQHQTQFGAADGNALAYDIGIAANGTVVVVGDLAASALAGVSRIGDVDTFVQMHAADLSAPLWTQVSGLSGVVAHGSYLTYDAMGDVWILATRSTPSGHADLDVGSYDAQGNSGASLSLGGGAANFEAGGLIVTADNSVFIAASTDVGMWGQAQVGLRDLALITLDTGGSFYGSRQWGVTNATLGLHGAVVSGGSVVVVGRTDQQLGIAPVYGSSSGFAMGILQTPLN